MISIIQILLYEKLESKLRREVTYIMLMEKLCLLFLFHHHLSMSCVKQLSLIVGIDQ